jgi:hypothetical protein
MSYLVEINALGVKKLDFNDCIIAVGDTIPFRKLDDVAPKGCVIEAHGCGYFQDYAKNHLDGPSGSVGVNLNGMDVCVICFEFVGDIAPWAKVRITKIILD